MPEPDLDGALLAVARQEDEAFGIRPTVRDRVRHLPKQGSGNGRSVEIDDAANPAHGQLLPAVVARLA